jgi:hypothetical protein
MNYQKIYNNIIANRLSNPINGYTEQHHILPRSLGGNDNLNNLVNLSAREHFICHYLLTRIYKDNKSAYPKMIKAFMMMMINSSNQKRYITSRRYERLRKEFSQIQSLNQLGVKNSQYGTIWIHSLKLKLSKKISKTDTIPNGWERGRVLNFELALKLKEDKSFQGKSLESINKIEKKRENKKIKIAKLKEWCTLYSKVGFDEFVKITGYKYSKPNLVTLFARWVPDFVPQNGKKRV